MTARPVAYACTQCFVVYHFFEEELHGEPVCEFCGRRLVRVDDEDGERED